MGRVVRLNARLAGEKVQHAPTGMEDELSEPNPWMKLGRHLRGWH